VLLTGLDAEHATVEVAGESRLIAIAELTHYDFGEHLMLWRPAIGGETGALAEGARGAGVVWLRTVLAELGHAAPAGADPDLFDAGLAAAVRDFQRAQGIFVDGVVGDHTLIQLQSEIGLVSVRLDQGMR